MAFYVYQGGEPADAVRWIYDGLPIVTANDQIASHTDHVYLCKVYYWDSSWEELGTLQSRGNKLNYGVFDVQTLALSGNPYTLEPCRPWTLKAHTMSLAPQLPTRVGSGTLSVSWVGSRLRKWRRTQPIVTTALFQVP